MSTDAAETRVGELEAEVVSSGTTGSLEHEPALGKRLAPAFRNLVVELPARGCSATCRMKPIFLTLILMLAAALQVSHAEESRKSVKLQLVSGDSITGTVSGIKDNSVSVISEYGVIRVPVEKLTEASRKELGISENLTVEQLQKRVKELESLVERLRSENSDLRKQTTEVPATPAPKVQPLVTGGATPTPPTPRPTVTPTPSASGGSFWISSTGKRHNSRCRYFGTGQGHSVTTAQGVACKICGG